MMKTDTAKLMKADVNQSLASLSRVEVETFNELQRDVSSCHSFFKTSYFIFEYAFLPFAVAFRCKFFQWISQIWRENICRVRSKSKF